jgi:carbonic anhydrase
LHDTARNTDGDHQSNADAADFLTNPPRSGAGFAILTRADANGSVSVDAEIKTSEALIIRKADGRASDDAIESLVLSHKLLGTKKWVVIHYIGDDETPLFDDAAIKDLLEHSSFAAVAADKMISNRPSSEQSAEEWNAAWVEFWQSASRNLGQVAHMIREDMDRIRNHPRTPSDVTVEGYIRDLKLQIFSRI